MRDQEKGQAFRMGGDGMVKGKHLGGKWGGMGELGGSKGVVGAVFLPE